MSLAWFQTQEARREQGATRMIPRHKKWFSSAKLATHLIQSLLVQFFRLAYICWSCSKDHNHNNSQISSQVRPRVGCAIVQISCESRHTYKWRAQQTKAINFLWSWLLLNRNHCLCNLEFNPLGSVSREIRWPWVRPLTHPLKVTMVVYNLGDDVYI